MAISKDLFLSILSTMHTIEVTTLALMIWMTHQMGLQR